MSKKYIVMLCIITFTIQGSSLYRSRQPILSAARNAYARGTNTISKLRPYTPHWTTCNKNMYTRPWAHRITNISKNAWTKPAVITGLAGAGLGTYCMRRNQVFAQENVQPEVRAFLQEAQKIINSLRNELPHCTDYACANIIFNKCENLIGIVLHNEYEGVSLQGAHQSAVKHLLKDILAVKKEAVAKALNFAQDRIWQAWHTSSGKTYYDQNLITHMLHHIGHYSGALFKYGIHPQGDNWVNVPPVYTRIFNAISQDPTLKKQFMQDLNNYHNAALQDNDTVTAQALLAIIKAIQSSLNV